MTELHCEEGHQGVEVIVPLEVEVEGGGEGDLLLLDSLNVNFFEQTVVGHDAFVINTVNKWFRNCDFSNT